METTWDVNRKLVFRVVSSENDEQGKDQEEAKVGLFLLGRHLTPSPTMSFVCPL
jgi:hypothetical protein